MPGVHVNVHSQGIKISVCVSSFFGSIGVKMHLCECIPVQNKNMSWVRGEQESNGGAMYGLSEVTGQYKPSWEPNIS